MTNDELDALLREVSPVEAILATIPPKTVDYHAYVGSLAQAISEEGRGRCPRFFQASLAGMNPDLRKWCDSDFQEKSFIPDDRGFFFTLHPRFVPTPKHRHTYLELVYVYSGSIEQEIEGERSVLEAGDVCVFDTMTPHALGRAGESDLMVNCLVRRTYLETSILARLAPGSSLTEFLLGTSFKGSALGGYRILRTADDPALREAVCRALREQYDPGPQSAIILESCLCLIFAELARLADVESRISSGSMSMLPDILRYIEAHCAELRLPTTAAHFGMKPGTFAAHLSRHLGKTFLDLVHEARLIRAERLLVGTDASIEDIAHEAGYANLGFFYRLFREKHGVTPAAFRSQRATRERAL